MRLLILICVLSSLTQSIYGCTCFVPSFCNYSDDLIEDETALTFRGSFIQEDSIEGDTKAMQFKVERIYSGIVVTPDSPFYAGEEYTNTDSTVWLLSGSSGSCLRGLETTKAIFTVTYNTGWPFANESVGYVPTICATDYFPISENETITGRIFEEGEEVVMPLSDFENLILNGCNDATAVESEIVETDCISVFPQPANDFLNIEICSYESIKEIILFNAFGQPIKKVYDSVVDISKLENGIYYLVFLANDKKYFKKIIKV